MITVKSTSLMLGALSLFVISAAADARPSRGKVSGPNGTATTIQGPNGGTTKVRGGKKNEDGSVTTGSGRTVQTKTGGGARGSTTTVNPDGTGTRTGKFSGKGKRGSAESSGSVTKNPDGTYSGSRTTTATSTATGGTYQGSTQIDPATGKPVRTATCKDAAGNVVACPR